MINFLKYGDAMKTVTLLIIALWLLVVAGCTTDESSQYRRYQDSIFDTFDTLIQVVAYAENEEEFRTYFDTTHEHLLRLHKLYDIYNSYDGINNIKTINDNAGISPVVVDRDIIELILFSRQWSEKTGGSVNIALGPVLEIWHYYREEALYDPENAELPPMARLREAEKHTDLSQVIVDEEKNTVFLPEEAMSLDVGAVAKGFALELVANKLVEEGLESAIISAGGNIRMIGRPMDEERDLWGVGVQNPDTSVISGGSDNLLDVIYIADGSIDTSGDYQRYFKIDGEMFHHLIDPETLMPASHYRAVTVVASGSGPADFISTALFLVPYEESLALVQSLDGFEALWVMHDGEVRTTAGMRSLLQSEGAGRQE